MSTDTIFVFFLEATTKEALNSDFFDSGVPINVTKVLEPTGLGSGDIFPGLGGLDEGLHWNGEMRNEKLEMRKWKWKWSSVALHCV